MKQKTIILIPPVFKRFNLLRFYNDNGSIYEFYSVKLSISFTVHLSYTALVANLFNMYAHTRGCIIKNVKSW